MNIYVGNLSYDLTEEDLKQVFGEFGEVTKVTLITDRDTGRAKGFGFIEMSDDSNAQDAIDELDGAALNGRNMRVNEAKPREDRPRRREW